MLEWINENPGEATKRDIARAFRLKGADRVALNALLAELRDDGAVEGKGRRFSRHGALPHTGVLEIHARDADGELLARPLEWNAAEHGEAPVIRIRLPRAAKSPPGIGDRVLARIEQHGRSSATARVIKQLERRPALTLGVVTRVDDKWRIAPVDRKQGEISLNDEALGEAKAGDLVEITVTRRGRYALPSAKIENIVGSVASQRAVSAIAIHTHGIPAVFRPQARAEAERVKPVGMTNREDWRDLPLITIDPADARDHDDAVHARADDDPDNAGGHIVTVAIADVSAYVPAGSAMDQEALKRGNSVYFPDRVVPMLPERISNDLCSLREDQDRPALAVRMVIDAAGRKRAHSFHRIMMRSAARLAYPQAQAAIDGNGEGRAAELLNSVLKPLWDAWRAMLKARAAREPLDLDLPERRVLLKEDGSVDRVIVPPRLEAHRLIEEYMIAANVAAAEELEKARHALIYRVHDAPSLAKQESLRDFLKTLDLSLPRGPQLRPSVFNGILAAVKETDVAELVNEVVLRSQSQAEYAPDNYGHFGLNLRRYAHFTSPIRRYADLTVHRALIAALGLGDETAERDLDRLREISGLISATERRAANAERDTVDRLIAMHLGKKTDSTFTARVSGMAGAGLFVTLNETGADGFIPASTLGAEYFVHDEAMRAMIGERSGKGWRLGDTVEVRLVEAQPFAGALRFEMLSEPGPLASRSASFHKSRRSGRPAGRGGKRRKR